MNDVSSSIDTSFARQRAQRQREDKEAAIEFARRKQVAAAFVDGIQAKLTQIVADLIRSGTHLFSVEVRWNAALAKEIVEQIVVPRYWWEYITFPLSGVYNSGVAWEGVYWLKSWDNPSNTPAGTPPNSWTVMVVYSWDLNTVSKELIVAPLVAMIQAMDERLVVHPPSLDYDRILVSLPGGELPPPRRRR